MENVCSGKFLLCITMEREKGFVKTEVIIKQSIMTNIGEQTRDISKYDEKYASI